jgi:hypothetical protein
MAAPLLITVFERTAASFGVYWKIRARMQSTPGAADRKRRGAADKKSRRRANPTGGEAGGSLEA